MKILFALALIAISGCMQEPTCGQKLVKAQEEIKALELCSQLLNCHIDIEDVRFAKALADSAVKCAKE